MPYIVMGLMNNFNSGLAHFVILRYNKAYLWCKRNKNK